MVLEVAAGASMAGGRALAAMKHVGLNVVADPLFTLAYTGVNGGLVVVTADDPGLFSSQNEQDNRYYASHAKLAMLEPSDSQSALTLSKRPSKFLKSLILLCFSGHDKDLPQQDTCQNISQKRSPCKTVYKGCLKYVMAPASAKKRKYIMEDRIEALKEFSETTTLNRIESASCKVGIITSGISYNHAKEVFGDEVSYLKLGFTAAARKTYKEICRYGRYYLCDRGKRALHRRLR